jgi:outer membrane protein OmpA-like peptidoglycan-associated protein
LLSKQVNASRITSQGMGPDMPIASNSTEEGRAANRRIEVYILEK